MNDNQGRERGSRKTTLADNQVSACPKCDATNVESRSTGDGRAVVDDTTAYFCRTCTARFDEYVVREKRHDPSPSGLAGDLLDADPDEVSR